VTATQPADARAVDNRALTCLIWRKSWQDLAGFPPCTEHAIPRFAQACRSACFSPPLRRWCL